MHHLQFFFLYVPLGGFGKMIIDNDKKGIRMLKMSELCIYLSVFIAFVTTGYLWYIGQKDEALFTATWIPSILTFVIYTEITNRKD